MSVGFPLTKDVLDNAIGGNAVQIRNAYDVWERLNAVVNNPARTGQQNIAALVALSSSNGVQYTSDEAAAICTFLSEMDQARQAFEGSFDMPQVNIKALLSPFIATS